MDIEELKDLHDELSISLNLAITVNAEYTRLDIHKDKLRLVVRVLRYVIDGGKEDDN